MKKLLILLLLFIPLLGANVNAPPIPVVDLTINGAQTPTQLVKTLNIVILMTLLVLAPSLILVMTSFVRLLVRDVSVIEPDSFTFSNTKFLYRIIHHL